MDKSVMTKRFSKAKESYNEAAEVQLHIARTMMHICDRFVPEPCSRIADIGCGTGVYSRMLFNRYLPESLILNDICSEMQISCKDLLDHQQVHFIAEDAEETELDSKQQLITSCSVIQWFHSPKQFFQKASRWLCDSGYLVFSTFGPVNLKEVTALTMQGLHYYSLAELKNWLQTDYDVLMAEEEIIVQMFPDPLDVLRHMKRTGVSGISSPNWTRGKMNEFCSSYRTRFGIEDEVPLSYHPIYFVARKKSNE